MAQKVVTQITSDLSGDENARTYTFQVEGVGYEIDLTENEKHDLDEALYQFVQAGRRVSGSRGRVAGTPSRASSNRRQDLDQVRAWAKDNGFEVAARGRVSKKVIEAYDAAH
jgi:Lsr2